MGNAQVLKINECNDCLKLTNSLVRDVQSHVNLVDHAVTGLARGVDALQSTCKLLLQRKLIQPKEQNEGPLASEEAEATVLQKIDEYITNNKIVMIEAVKKLFLCIKMNVNNHVENLDEAFNMLAVQNYEELQTENSLHCNWVTDYFYKRDKQLNIQIEHLTTQIDLQRKQIEILNEREETYLEESKMFSEQIRKKTFYSENTCLTNNIEATLKSNNGLVLLDSRSSHNLNESFGLERDILDANSMICDGGAEIQSQQTRISSQPEQSLICSKIKAKVQIFRRISFPNTKNVEDDLLQNLQKEIMASYQIHLDFKRCQGKSEIRDHFPLLISSQHCTTTERNSIVNFALEGLEKKPNIAVIVYHHKPEPDIWKEIELYDDTVSGLGGIFHFGYIGKLYDSEMNKKNIIKLADFIRKFAVKETEI